MGFSVLEPGAVYEVKLVAYNGNGESDCSKRLVSLAEEGTSAQTTGEDHHRVCPRTAFSNCTEQMCEVCTRRDKYVIPYIPYTLQPTTALI